jgi:hypothetical protein
MRNMKYGRNKEKIRGGERKAAIEGKEWKQDEIANQQLLYDANSLPALYLNSQPESFLIISTPFASMITLSTYSHIICDNKLTFR